MGKRARRERKSLLEATDPSFAAASRVRRNKSPLKPLTEGQKNYIMSISASTLTFAIGPAGTGKTFICATMAADALQARETERIIITRPAIEAGESLGYLPGELDEKFDPYFRPFRDVLEERLGSGHVEALIKNEYIVALPLAYMRGRTFKNCWVILDEAQNTTPLQMKLFLTRIGDHSKVIVNGDITQKDIGGMSGLEDAINRLKHLDDVAMVEFFRSDIVRSGLVREIVERYET